MTSVGLAFARANWRYWRSVGPLVHEQLRYWELRAQTIPDAVLRAQAHSKLHKERFNVELAGTLATLAKDPYRQNTVRAIVALQVMYDYLDLLTEQPLADPVLASSCLFEAFTDALTPEERTTSNYYRNYPHSQDGGYLLELVETIRDTLTTLPSTYAIGPIIRRGAVRCAHAQILVHAAAIHGTTDLRRWADSQVENTNLHWQEFIAAAAASVLAIHALIATAANPSSTPSQAEQIDAAYLSICALTMLDSVVDREHDIASGELNYIQCYESEALMAARLGSLAGDAKRLTYKLPNGPHHLVTLVGVVAFYSSAASARSASARALTAPARRVLKPLITPTLILMRGWRMAKLVGSWRRTGAAIFGWLNPLKALYFESPLVIETSWRLRKPGKAWR